MDGGTSFSVVVHAIMHDKGIWGEVVNLLKRLGMGKAEDASP